MTTPTTTIELNQAPAQRAANRTITLTTDTITRSRPLPPTPAPAPRAAKPWMITDLTAAVIAAFLTGDHPDKSVSDLVEQTGLPRGTVCSTVAALASAGRVERVVNDSDGYIIIRWTLLR